MRSVFKLVVLIPLVSCSSHTTSTPVGCNWAGKGELQDYSITASANIAGDQLQQLKIISTSGAGSDLPSGICTLDVLKSTDAKISTGIGAPPRELRIESSTNQDFADMAYSIENEQLTISPVMYDCALLPKRIDLKADPSACSVQW